MRHIGDETTAFPQTDEFERAEHERRSTWARRCASGERSPIDHLTDCERAVITSLRAAGYDLTGRRYNREIVRREAA